MIEKINEELKNAMKNKDTFKLSVLRMLKSALQLEGIAKKHELGDEEVLSVIKKQVKLRKDSLDEYQKYNKLDEVASLEEEIKILSIYLPEELSEEDVAKLVNKAIDDVKPTSMKDMGLVMKAMNELLVGKNADMSLVSKLVKEAILTK